MYEMLYCVTFLQYSWLSITPPFPNHIKLEQLESISRDALQCSQLASAIFGATILWLLWTWSICSCKNCAKINLPFQSLLELENQLAHDALNELIASNYCKYCLKVVFHLQLSFCRTNYTSMMSAMCLIMKQSTSTKLVKSSQAVSRSRTSLGGVALPC